MEVNIDPSQIKTKKKKSQNCEQMRICLPTLCPGAVKELSN